MTKHQILEDVDKTSIQLKLQEAFFGHFFIKLLRDVVDREHPVQTAAVSLNPITNTLSLLINDNFWTNEITGDEQQKKDKKYGLIKHEILHILFKDLFNHHKFSDVRLGNMAVDVRVNQYILPHQLPGNPESICTLENFPDFFDPVKDREQTAYFYYDVFLKQMDEVRKILGEGQGGQSSGQGKGKGKGSNQGNQNDQNNQDNQDDSGGNEGEDGDEEQDGEGNGQSDSQKNPNWDKLNNSQKKLTQFVGSEANMRMHSTWGEINKLKEGNKEFIENWTNSMINETVKQCDQSKEGGTWRGKMPAGIMAAINEILEALKPSVNWKRMLRKFAQNGIKSESKTTLRRQSKRYGTFPGRKTVIKHKIMIAIDTSGSVCNESLAEFFSEVKNIWKTGSDVRIVECDASIGNIWDYKGTFPTYVTGRGGTSFDPPIIYANEEYKPDVLIYFTDGECSPPPKCNCPIMWILSKNQGATVEQMADFQGIKVKMNF